MKPTVYIAIVFIVAIIGAALPGHCNRSQFTPTNKVEPASVIAESPRPCVTWPHALVKCGVWSQEEFNKARLEAATNDPELERAYGPVGHLLFRVTATKDRPMYANYRQGSHIVWTPVPLIVRAGETVLMDADGNLVRARCGNLLSETPREPKAFVMPPEMEHETPTVIWPDDAPVLPPASYGTELATPPMVAFIPPADELPVSPRGPFLPSLIPPMVGAAAIPPAVFLGGPPVIVRSPVIRGTPEPTTLWLCCAAALFVAWRKVSS